MTTSTYIIRNTEGTVTDARTSPSMPYTHAVVDSEFRARSWHLTEAAARKASSGGKWTLSGNVVSVEEHEGGKATVLRRLAKEAVVSSTAAETLTPKAGSKRANAEHAARVEKADNEAIFTDAVSSILSGGSVSAEDVVAASTAKKAERKAAAAPATGSHKFKWLIYVDGSTTAVPFTKSVKATGWDVTCSCGWETATGGASNSAIHKMIKAHKAGEPVEAPAVKATAKKATRKASAKKATAKATAKK